MRRLTALALLLSLASSASAYSHSFTNRSPVTVRFWVNYTACSNDTWYVKPGQVITWRSGLCCISDVNVQGQRGTETSVAGVNIPGGGGWPSMRWPMMACRNSNWVYDSSKNGHSSASMINPQDFSITGP
jgi:hypothetical protein